MNRIPKGGIFVILALFILFPVLVILAQNMRNGQSLFMLAFGAVALALGFRTLNRKRLLENIPTSTIRSAAMGLCEIKAEAAASGDTYTAPLTGRTCVWYRTIGEKYVKTKDSGHWREVARDEQGRYLYLRDETGTCLLDIDGADLHLNEEKDRKAWPEELGRKPWGRTRVREISIEPGEQLYVLGDVSQNPDKKTKERAPLLIKGPAQYFVVSEKPEKQLTQKLLFLAIFLLFVGVCLVGLGFLSMAGLF